MVYGKTLEGFLIHIHLDSGIVGCDHHYVKHPCWTLGVLLIWFPTIFIEKEQSMYHYNLCFLCTLNLLIPLSSFNQLLQINLSNELFILSWLLLYPYSEYKGRCLSCHFPYNCSKNPVWWWCRSGWPRFHRSYGCWSSPRLLTLTWLVKGIQDPCDRGQINKFRSIHWMKGQDGCKSNSKLNPNILNYSRIQKKKKK